MEDSASVLSLKQPPKWLRRPVSASFGFGGLLTSVSNLPGPSGRHQSGVVHIRSVTTEHLLADDTVLDVSEGQRDKLVQFCKEKAEKAPTDGSWKTLQALFKADSRDEWITLLGFAREDVVKQVSEAIKQLPAISSSGKSRESLVTFTEPEKVDLTSDVVAANGDTPPMSGRTLEGTPSEVSATSDNTKHTETTEMTDEGLFDDHAPGTPAATDADFFSSMAAGSLRNPQLDNIVPHQPEVAESSVAATIGSRASSVRSEAIRDHTFQIYPPGESDIDKLITQALVLGDFASAVELCLASERYADALLLAVRGGPELLQSTQKAYFARRTTSHPFLRVFQSIVTEDLIDIVQNADLSEWKVAFAVLCTFAKNADFSSLADQLGQRLQFKWQMSSGLDSPEAKQTAKTARQDALLCYLAARKLEKVVAIWVDEMREEEEALSESVPIYSAHSKALQSFVQKVTVFIEATGYVDDDMQIAINGHETEAGVRTYKLAALYDRMYEYADLLANQGHPDIAAQYVDRTPLDYLGTGGAGYELDKARTRIFRAADRPAKNAQTSDVFGAPVSTVTTQAPSRFGPSATSARLPAMPTYTQPTSFNPSYGQPPMTTPFGSMPPSQSFSTPNSSAYVPAPSQPSTYGADPYAPPPNQGYHSQPSAYPAALNHGQTNGYGPPEPQSQGYGALSAGYGAPSAAYGAPSAGYGAPPSTQTLAPLPQRGMGAPSTTEPPPPPPAAMRRDLPGWNDAPSLAGPPKRPQSAAKEIRPAPIMSPFPMSEQPFSPDGNVGGPNMGLPPSGPPQSMPLPPRTAPGVLPPPPKGSTRPPSAAAVAKAAAPQSLSPPMQQQPQHPSQMPPPPSPARQPPMRQPPVGRGGPPPGVMAGPPPRALSPLGPQGQIASPMGQSMRAPSAGPPPPGAARVAGPPPPGRTSSQTSPQALTQASGPATPTPPVPSAPAEPVHPTHRE